MSQPDRPIIVGAGPVGLGAALFLARYGCIPRVVEMRAEPSHESKALAVNPRTLDILEPTGLTGQMLELGMPIHGGRFYRQGKLLAAISFAGIHPKYPYMLALSQAVTERLLAQGFEAAGGKVEHGVKLVKCRNTGEPLWRILSNRPDPLCRLVQAEQAGLATWTSSFHISHCIGAALSAGSVYLAGDAAHIHSPVGARGMNLGLEDARIFAELAQTNRLAAYNRLRRPVDSQVVRRVEFISRIVSPESGFYRFLRTFVFPTVIKMPFLPALMVRTVTGLDHELPHLTTSQILH